MFDVLYFRFKITCQNFKFLTRIIHAFEYLSVYTYFYFNFRFLKKTEFIFNLIFVEYIVNRTDFIIIIVVKIICVKYLLNNIMIIPRYVIEKMNNK